MIIRSPIGDCEEIIHAPIFPNSKSAAMVKQVFEIQYSGGVMLMTPTPIPIRIGTKIPTIVQLKRSPHMTQPSE